MRATEPFTHSITDSLDKILSSDVRIELFTARVLCKISARVLEYSTDSGISY